MPVKPMVLTDEEKKDIFGPPSLIDDKPKYHPALKLRLPPEVVEKLGLNKLPNTGDTLSLIAEVEVAGVEMDKHRGDEEKVSLTLQITDMGLGSGEEEKVKDAGQVLYGDM